MTADVSEDAKTTFGLNEDRISFGILILLIIAGIGYGVWLMLKPWLDGAQVSDPLSRRQVADQFSASGEYPEAVDVYKKMLADDPWNGLANAKLAVIYRRMLEEDLKQLENLPAAETSIREEQLESQIEQHLDASAEQLELLTRHDRFRRLAFRALIDLYCSEAKRKDDREYVAKAIETVRSALSAGFKWDLILETEQIAYLSQYPEFENSPEFRQLFLEFNLWDDYLNR